VLHEVPKGGARREIFVVQGPEPRDGQPTQIHPEKYHEEQGQPEGGHGKTDKDEDTHRHIEPRILMDRREHP